MVPYFIRNRWQRWQMSQVWRVDQSFAEHGLLVHLESELSILQRAHTALAVDAE